MLKSTRYAFLALLAIGALIAGCTEDDDNGSDSGNGSSTPSASASPGSGGTANSSPSAGGSTTTSATGKSEFSRAIDAVRPATVQITSQQVVQLNRLGQTGEVPAGVGSGVIYKSEGYIITNDHVISGAQSLLVSLPDGRSFPGKLVGADPRTDLAVLKIDSNNLPVARLGNSDQLGVGEWTVAIGNALGLPGGPTVTVGVVSALGRTAQEPGAQGAGEAGPILFDLIQTDASINPGNSGGPLVNINGDVIGINTMIAGQVAEGIQAQGIGFAQNINNAKRVADQLEATGKFSHAYLGVSYVPVTPVVAAQLGLTVKNGAVVASTVPGSPAAQANLQRGDVITQVDGKDIKAESDLTRYIDQKKPGDKVTLTVVSSGGQERKVDVTLGEFPA